MPVPKKTITKEVKVPRKKPVKKAVLSDSKSKVVQNMFAKKLIAREVIKPVGKKVAKAPAKIKKTTSKKSTKKSDEVVYITSSVSLRLKEKALLYRLWYKDNVQSYAAKTAQYGGYAFIVLGILLTSFNYLLDKGVIGTPAAVLCSNETCHEIADADLPPGSPLVEFLTNIPETVSSDIDLQVKTENLSEFKISLIANQSGVVIDLEPSTVMSATDYRFLISPSLLKSVSYTVIAETKVEGTSYKFTGPSFIVSVPKEQIAIPEATSTTPVNNASSTASSTEKMPLNETDKAASSSTANVTTNSTSTNSSTSTNARLDSGLPISIAYEETLDSKYISIKTGNYLPRTVEVYTSVLGNTNPVLLGLATLVQGEWIFSLSALDLPKTDNLIFASFVSNNEKFTSDGITFNPEYSQAKDQNNDAELEIANQKITTTLEESGLDFSLRSTYFSKLYDTEDITLSQDSESQMASGALRTEITKVMLENTDDINLLLKHYASAVQIGNPYLINLADTQIKVRYETMAETVAQRVGRDTSVPSVMNLFALRFHALEKAVTERESGFTASSNNLFSKDSDKDGISDYDELRVYNLNATAADTDMDGVLDGVEVLVGRDPNLSDLTSFAFLEQNIEETNSEEVVSISSVQPLVYKQQGSSEDLVFAVVRGKSIPNSFVYIFNYVESTVGVIKTNEAGEFLYTLEKNLNDGSQEFIAVLVDNSGNVVTNSGKYSFVKTTNSFAAAAAANKQATFELVGNNNSFLSANVIASVTIVSLGFILLLLSQAVQIRKRHSLEIKTVKPA